MDRYQMKKGSQQRTNAPMMMPSVRAALCSRRIFWRCLSLLFPLCDSPLLLWSSRALWSLAELAMLFRRDLLGVISWCWAGCVSVCWGWDGSVWAICIRDVSAVATLVIVPLTSGSTSGFVTWVIEFFYVTSHHGKKKYDTLDKVIKTLRVTDTA